MMTKPVCPSALNTTLTGLKPTESSSPRSMPGSSRSTATSWKLPAGTPWLGREVSRYTTA
ncbi:MAG: hypothetical protein IPF99_02175 [Deltaproteobacteria bacterium]|nr:hypothetical protein [Deltaproteobacteria bacterium]